MQDLKKCREIKNQRGISAFPVAESQKTKRTNREREHGASVLENKEISWFGLKLISIEKEIRMYPW